MAAFCLGSAAVLGVAGTYGASAYYTSQQGAGCASCHEMAIAVTGIHGSGHRNVGCLQCHDARLRTKLRHIAVHLRRSWPEEIRLRDADAIAMTASCARCHQQEYATWQAGPHSATYQQIFADAAHNRQRRLTDDCLRCHGMHFDGPVRDLVQPVSLAAPSRVQAWRVQAAFAGQPTMPCAACHGIHRAGSPATRPATRISVAGQPVPDSLAFFDRRERMHFAAAALAIPQVYDGARPVPMSADPRQSICYQCHAPREPETGSMAGGEHWGMQAGSGDDRTPLGVHEGLSCFSCHNGHNENARASCVTCHARMSDCGIDVEKMDTTYANPASRHNIHSVRCVDCHTHGVPRPGGAAVARDRAAAARRPAANTQIP